MSTRDQMEQDMVQTQNRRLMELFDAVVDLGPAEQAEFLSRLSADRDPLCDRLEALLVQDRKPLDYRLEVADIARVERDELASADQPPCRRRSVPTTLPVAGEAPRAPGEPIDRTAGPPRSIDGADAASAEQVAFSRPIGRICQYEVIRELGRGGMHPREHRDHP